MKITSNPITNNILNTEADFLAVFNQYAPYIARRISKYDLDAFIAEDVKQEIAAEFWEAVAEGKITSNPTAYLYSLTRNICDKEKSKKKRRPTTISFDDLTKNKCSEALCQEPGILEGLEQKRQTTLQNILEIIETHLSPLDCQLLTKRFFDKANYDDLANEYRMTKPAVRKRISRGLKQIRNLL